MIKKSTVKDCVDTLKDLCDIRSRVLNEFEPLQELEKYLLVTSMIDEKINDCVKRLDENLEEE